MTLFPFQSVLFQINLRYKNLHREQNVNSESFHEFFKLKAEVCAGYEKDFEQFHDQLIESSTQSVRNGIWSMSKILFEKL